MSPFLVFNELSATQLAPTLDVAATWLSDWFDLALDQRVSHPRVLVVPDHFLQMPVGRGFSVGRWLSVQPPDTQEKRILVKLLLDKRWDFDTCLNNLGVGLEDVEYLRAGEGARGLSVAHCADGLALSFRSDEDWDEHSVSVDKTWIEGNDVQSRPVEVRHASQPHHLDWHKEWLARQRNTAPSNGEMFWEERVAIFPRLDFCSSVEDQILMLSGNDQRFKDIWRGLQLLQSYCEKWDSPSFDIHSAGNASGESRPTLEKYSQERTFLCPDGTYQLFQWHVKRGKTRIHFLPVPTEKRILVGYVGPHLRIVSGL